MIQSCDAPSLLPVNDALNSMLAHVSALTDTESLLLEYGLGRILSQDLVSGIQVPPAANSAMDGYALRSQDLDSNQQLTLVGQALAGQPYQGEVTSGQCVRIMTGAIIPQGADAVVMQENTRAQGNNIAFLQQPDSGNNVRRAGEDIQLNQVVVAKGTLLTPAHLALIASVGINTIEVVRKLKVGIIATGDELTPAGEPLTAGCIYESNRFALRALLAKHPVEIIDYGIVKDDKQALTDTLTKADEQCDLVLSCGGVSVGDADYVKQILEQLGQINFWKVAIKPGKPFAFGKLNNAWFCGLPGNPVSSYVTFEKLVAPLIAHLTQQTPIQAHYFVAKAAETIRKRPGRADYQRGVFYRDENGELWVKANGKQGSGIMSSIANANCYMLLSQSSGNIEQGQSVKIQPFNC